MKDYTTALKIDRMIGNKDIPKEVIDEEAKKTIISDDAFAVCDFIEQLKKEFKGFRIATLIR
jgi:hypothetical protein